MTYTYSFLPTYANEVTDDDVYVMGFCEIHTQMFMTPAETDVTSFPPGLPCTQDEAEYAFKQVGWDGDGSLRIIWLPPFMFASDFYGVLLWHATDAKGVSWLCAKGVIPMLNEYTGGKRWQGVNLQLFRSGAKE